MSNFIVVIMIYSVMQLVVIFACFMVLAGRKSITKLEEVLDDYIDFDNIVYVYKKDFFRTYRYSLLGIIILTIIFLSTLGIILYIKSYISIQNTSIIVISVVYLFTILLMFFHFYLSKSFLKSEYKIADKEFAARSFKNELYRKDIINHLEDIDLREIVNNLSISSFTKFQLKVGDKFVFWLYKKKIKRIGKSHKRDDIKYFKLLQVFISYLKTVGFSYYLLIDIKDKDIYIQALFDKFIYYVNYYFVSSELINN